MIRRKQRIAMRDFSQLSGEDAETAKKYSTEQMIDLVFTIGQYNLVSWALNSLGVPLKAKMGTAWDVAYAALFLHSDESAFITGVALPVDGGQSARIG